MIHPFKDFHPERFGLGIQVIDGECEDPNCGEACSTMIEFTILWFSFGVIVGSDAPDLP